MAKGESYTNVEAYKTYEKAERAALDGKERVKTLRKEWERAGDRVKYEMIGTHQEKRAAIQAAIAPYREQIAQVEEEIKKNYAIADENFDIWKGLK